MVRAELRALEPDPDVELDRVGGGDGFQTQVDPTDYRVLYSESQNGNINRYDLARAAAAACVQRRHRRRARRWWRWRRWWRGRRTRQRRAGAGDGDDLHASTWNSPIRISPHNPRKILFGGDRFFVSLDRGDTWTMSQQRLGKNLDSSERTIMGIRYSNPSCGRGGGGGGGRGAAPPAGGPPPTTCILSKDDGVGANESGTSSRSPNRRWSRASTGPAPATATSR